jgi:hypothetical protein
LGETFSVDDPSSLLGALKKIKEYSPAEHIRLRESLRQFSDATALPAFKVSMASLIRRRV